MMNRSTLAALAITLFLTACASKPPTATVPHDFSAQKWLEARWIMEVLTLGESGDRRLNVARWTKPVVMVANNGTEAQLSAVQQAFEEVRTALDGVHPFTLVTNGTHLAKTAPLRVYFAPLKEWPTMGKSWGLPAPLPDKGLDGVHFVRWNENVEIEAGIIVIADELDPKKLQHTMLEELYQAMGIRNDSGFFRDSIVYESGGDTGGQLHLSERDKKLIRFLYQHVPPGTLPGELARLIDEHWVYGAK
ncbi:MAG: hypothetical protein K0Q55_1039 [Verrucomicrobia bacterium]|jgi:hypothetical protein|nr:hypothetical protein [Verrucomicrobiota bacterium]